VSAGNGRLVVTYSEILLSPNSAEQISFTLKDANKQPIDFSVGYWAARLSIVRYPGSLSGAFHVTGTSNLSGVDSKWLSFEDSKLIMIPDPDVTAQWSFTRYHYDCYLIGPNVTSKPINIVHGPFIMDL
jgi:hypothetical protein